MQLNNRRKIILLIFILLFIQVSYCGDDTNSNSNSNNNKSSQAASGKDRAYFESLLTNPNYKARSAIILDFVNESDESEYDKFSTLISERLFRDLNKCFSMIDTTFVRNYLSEKKIDSKSLYDKKVSSDIGAYFGVDVVIRGRYIVVGSEVQITGEITSINDAVYNDFTYTSKISDFLSQLNKLSEKVYNVAIYTFPPKKIDEKNIIKENTNTVTLIKIVEKYKDNKEVSSKTKPKPDSETLEEIPSPRPKWTWEIPQDKDYIYFIGQSMQGDNFETALKSAIQDAYLSMSRAVGKQIESAYSKKTYSGPKGTYNEITGNIIVKTLNYVRGEEISGRYYRKIKDNTYEACVLFKLSKAKLNKCIGESVIAEAERLQEAKSKAIAKKEEAEAENLKAQLEILKLIEKRKENLKIVESNEPIYKYDESTTKIESKGEFNKEISGSKSETIEDYKGGYRELYFSNRKR